MAENVHTGEQGNVATIIDHGLYHKARNASFVGAISAPHGRPEVTGTAHNAKVKLRKTSIIKREKIEAGEDKIFTMRHKGGGEAAFGDAAPKHGEGATYSAQKVFVNRTKSPRIPVEGEESQAVFRQVTKKLPSEARNDTREWAREEIDKSAILGLTLGMNPALMAPRSVGGKHVALGNFGAPGVAQMCRNFFVAGAGFLDFNTNQNQWNDTVVNTAINNLTAGLNTRISAANQKSLRYALDTMHFRTPTVNVRGKGIGNDFIRAVNFCDPSLIARLKEDLGDLYKYARERGKQNPLWSAMGAIIWQDMAYVPVPQFQAFRPVYDANIGRPKFGADIFRDHREYIEDTPNRLMVTVGDEALLETYRGAVSTTVNEGAHKTGMDYVTHFYDNFMRAEWWSMNKSRTDAGACINQSTIVSVYTEDEF